MQIRLTDDAQRFLAELNQAELTVSSLMFTYRELFVQGWE